jgi:hypothetical protein
MTLPEALGLIGLVVLVACIGLALLLHTADPIVAYGVGIFVIRAHTHVVDSFPSMRVLPPSKRCSSG